MIHTYELRIDLSDEQIRKIMFRYDFKPLVDIIREIEEGLQGVQASLVIGEKETFIRLHVDAIVALQTYIITKESISTLLDIHSSICDYLLLDSLEMLNQTRIDYRIDIKVLNKEHRKLIMKLFHKTKHKHYHLKTGKLIYISTIQLENKSMEVKVYDKEIERRAKGKKISEAEKDVLRFEVALRNRHLKYNKKKKSIAKELQSYLTEELHYKYMNKIVEVFLPGNFYYLSDAELLLEKKGLPRADIKMVREMMLTMSTKGYEGVKKEFSDYKIRKCLGILKEENIHPVPIPQNEFVEGYSIESPLKNPVNEIFELTDNN